MTRMCAATLFFVSFLASNAFGASHPPVILDDDPAPVSFSKGSVVAVFHNEGYHFCLGEIFYTVLGQLPHHPAWESIPDDTSLTFTWSGDAWYHKQLNGLVNIFLWPVTEGPESPS